MGVSVRISVASPEADLAAAVRPGVSTILLSRVESTDQVRTADALVGHLERHRGIRPGTVELNALIESPKGVSVAHDVVRSARRLASVGVGPNMSIYFDTDTDAASYAAAECELHALASGLTALNVQYVLD